VDSCREQGAPKGRRRERETGNKKAAFIRRLPSANMYFYL
jgi:hypothetical protein